MVSKCGKFDHGLRSKPPLNYWKYPHILIMGEMLWLLYCFNFLLLPSSFLQVTTARLKIWMSLNFGQIRQLTTMLAAIERLKNQYHHFFSILIDPNFLKLAYTEAMHNILDDIVIRPDWTADKCSLPLSV